MANSTDNSKIEELLTRGIAAILPSREALEKRLRGKGKLHVYLGIDPTSPHLHLGHAAPLFLLRRFQNLGHKVTLLVGDFTARIGDPTDKLAMRQPLTEAQIDVNLKTFRAQAGKILNLEYEGAAIIRFNSEWHDGMPFGELIELAHHFTVQQMLERDMFQNRMKSDKPIFLHEFLYPLMQGYDSVALDVDAEVGGNDQLFNMMAGRTLMKVLKNKEKFVLTTKLLIDETSGKKLSKTERSLVNLDDDPRDMFGKVMALPDSMIGAVAELSTMLPMNGVRDLAASKNPREAKLALAEELVRTFHSSGIADKVRAEWIQTFSKKSTPLEAPELVVPRKMTVTDLVVRATETSKTEARRLVQQNAIELDGVILTDSEVVLTMHSGIILRVGKHRFFKITTK